MKKLIIFSKAILAFLMLSGFARQGVHADSACDCIDVSAFRAPNNQIRYTITCYFAGEKRETLEEGLLADSKLITEKADSFKATYKAQDCLWFPGGKRIAPKNK